MDVGCIFTQQQHLFIKNPFNFDEFDSRKGWFLSFFIVFCFEFRKIKKIEKMTDYKMIKK